MTCKSFLRLNTQHPGTFRAHKVEKPRAFRYKKGLEGHPYRLWCPSFATKQDGVARALSGSHVLRTQSRYTVSRYTCRTEIPQLQRRRGSVAPHPPKTRCHTLWPPPPPPVALSCAQLPFPGSGHHMPTLKPSPGPSPSVMAASSFRHFQRFFVLWVFVMIHVLTATLSVSIRDRGAPQRCWCKRSTTPLRRYTVALEGF